MAKVPSKAPENNIPLADMIQQLRHELQRAQDQSENEAIIFETEKVELELQVAVSRTGKGKAGIEFWVVNAGGAYEKANAMTHTFKLTLLPISTDTGKRAKVTSKTKTKASKN